MDSLACCDMLVGWVFINVIDVRQLGPSLKHVLLHALIEYDLKKVAIVSQQDFLYKKTYLPSCCYEAHNLKKEQTIILT